MKIAFIVDSFPVLSETFILSQAIGLLKRGHDVRIFARCRPSNHIVPHEDRRLELVKRRRYLDKPLHRRRGAAWMGVMARTQFRAPFRALRWLNEFRRGAISLEKLNLILPFIAEKFDVIHCHFGQNGLLGIFIKETISHTPVVTSYYGYDLSLLLALEGRDMYKDLFRSGDLFLPLSSYFKGRLIDLGCDRSKIIVFRVGIDLNRFSYLPRILHHGEPIQLLSVGRLVEKKGHEYTLRALARVASRGRDIRLKIVGDGPLRGRLELLSREMDITDRVDFLGSVDHDEVIKLLSQAHIFALPSMAAVNGDQEGIPFALMEAQASGLPVLSTLHSGIPELVSDGESGYLVPERDEEALADRLNYLVDHPEIWPGMGRRGREIVEKEFNTDILISGLEKIYASLIEGRLTSRGANSAA